MGGKDAVVASGLIIIIRPGFRLLYFHFSSTKHVANPDSKNHARASGRFAETARCFVQLEPCQSLETASSLTLAAVCDD